MPSMKFTGATLLVGNAIYLKDVSGEIQDSGTGVWNGTLRCPNSPDAVGALFKQTESIYLDIGGRVRMKIAVKNATGDFVVG
jgi:hypothetical protein